MDKRKAANQRVKDRLLSALIEFSGYNDWSKLTITELIEKSGVARASFTGILNLLKKSLTTESSR